MPISSLFTGVLGLKNHQTRMDVIANNVANVNTTGFKMGRADFKDLFSKTIRGAASPQGARGGINPLQKGMGVQTASITNIMTQGQIQTTGRLTDVAIDGNGFFIASDRDGRTLYTRDGTFFLDRDGSLVTSNGLYVQGWDRVYTTSDHNFEVDTSQSVGEINFMQGEKLAAQETDLVNMKSNLDEQSRSIVADGLDPTEGWANRTDLLVDLYDDDSTSPSHLGVREGDWIEIVVGAGRTNRTENATPPDSLGTPQPLIAADNNTDSYQFIPQDTLPVLVDSTTSNFNIDILDSGGAVVGTLTAADRFFGPVSSPAFVDQAGAAPTQFMIDEGSGQIVFNSDFTGGAFTIELTYSQQVTADTQVLAEPERYMYVQVTNDMDLGDLERYVNQALQALDEHSTMNARAYFDETLGRFVVYNEAVTRSGDELDLTIDINAVSGSAIRRGFQLQDSTFATLTGTALNVLQGAVGNNMTREVIGTLDYQTVNANLDYGNVVGTQRIYGKLHSAYIQATFDDADNFIDLAGTSTDVLNGFTNGGSLAALKGTEVIRVNGTAYRSVQYFTGAANEYIFDTTTNLDGTPIIRFNDVDAGVGYPTDGDTVTITFNVDNDATNTEVLLDENIDYSFDPDIGQLTFIWNGSGQTSTLSAGAGAGFTGSVRYTAEYTTENRSLTPPAEVMNSRWADFVQEWAPLTAGGSGRGRTGFDAMFDSLNVDAVGSGAVISDQGSTDQPTARQSSRLQSGAVHRTAIDVYDSLGEAHTLQIVFTHVGSNFDLTTNTTYQNRWYWRAELPWDDVMAFDSMDLNFANNGQTSRSGQIQFGDDGLIVTSQLPGQDGPIRFDASPVGANGQSTGAVNETSILLDFDGDEISNDPALKRGVTQFASDFTTAAFAQNGWAMGILETFTVDPNGIIQGRFSNNIVKPLAQMGIAGFANSEGLSKEGSNYFAVTANSGLATINTAMRNGNGQIVGGALEGSNVDLAEEFTNMIVTERGFQGNSRVITTSDEMLQELINLKR